MDINLLRPSIILALLAMAVPSQAQITINIRYTAENGGARAYVKEMEKSGLALWANQGKWLHLHSADPRTKLP